MPIADYQIRLGLIVHLWKSKNVNIIG